MSLIAGMEDVVKHIKNQEVLIQKLEEKNKALQVSNNQYVSMFNFVVKSEKEKIDEIEKLKQENKKMKDMLLKFKKECNKVKMNN